ncbi:hypothetical protein CPB83DRAFT_768637 [Crepidotus variabilis]|uniref:Ribosomal lysine N-methyltransferase 4 n=1 Tax=Crepidotus variabilis TaxID=179855 RepID=A0A9P6EDY7_9AGAR|nr:hypothetical protein CPB83DRAFT_768637 [Crepidotus variabilis]
MPTPDIEFFFRWFETLGGYLDREAIDIAQMPASEGGRGVVALIDIPEGQTLFSMPRTLLLGVQTSNLRFAFGEEAWKAAKLHERWSGIILCLMWEAAKGPESRWAPYFDIMPIEFDTPMFWSNDELAELNGTAVADKIGKEQVEADYHQKVLPAMKSRSDLFSPDAIPKYYSLEVYHLMGTRLLTRSFTIEQETDEEPATTSQAEDTITAGDISTENDHVDAPLEAKGEDEDEDEDEDADNEDEDTQTTMVMVPMADMLNARYKANHAKLFYEPDCLRMVTIKPIKAGEQILNTYGNPPNSELLRRCGHVDYLSLPSELYGDNTFGNPGDIVELPADQVVQVALKVRGHNETQEDILERIDWWLEEGGDDVFILEIDDENPATLESLDIPIAFARLILHDDEWERAKAKGKPPKPKLEEHTLRVLKEALERRLQDYATTLEDDERLLTLDSPPRKRSAIIVRIGEKRLLHLFLARTSVLLAKTWPSAKDNGATNSGKRKPEKGEKSRKRQKA